MYYYFEQLSIDRFFITPDRRQGEALEIGWREFVEEFKARGAFVNDEYTETQANYQNEFGAWINSYRLGRFKSLDFVKQFCKESVQRDRKNKADIVNARKLTGETNILDENGVIVEQTSNCHTGVCGRFEDGKCREYGEDGCHDLAGFDPKKIEGSKDHHISLADFKKMVSS
ncbi:hypothetical protein EBT25_00975 [bacterium]|jgi:hypothetical protein|nr:hypothetical protein [bacterium]